MLRDRGRIKEKIPFVKTISRHNKFMPLMSRNICNFLSQKYLLKIKEVTEREKGELIHFLK